MNGVPSRTQQAPVGRDVPAVLQRSGSVQLGRRDGQTVGPEDRRLAARRGGAAEPRIRSGPSVHSHTRLRRVAANDASRFSTGGVVWRIRASDTRLVCAAGSRNGTEETKLLVLDFDLDDRKRETE